MDPVAPRPAPPRHRAVSAFIYLLFFSSGFAALLYQVIWQRVLAIFSGADVYSVTIIVAAFMAGLGCGSLAGGYLADRLPAGRPIFAFAGAELAIGLFSLVSIPIYYDGLYVQWGWLAGSPLLAGVLFVVLLWPTFFMGLSLPLLARTLTHRVAAAAGTIGALYACNTLGAAVGAFVTTWILIRALGFAGTVQAGALLNFLAAGGGLLAAAVLRSSGPAPRPGTSGEPAARRADDRTAGPAPRPAAPSARGGAPLFALPVWLAIYALSGLIALALEIIWFRALGVMLKSTAFTFGNLLAIFLLGLALGTFGGLRLAPRSRHAPSTFLLLQTTIPLYAVLALALFTYGLDHWPPLTPFWRYFGSYEPMSPELAYTFFQSLPAFFGLAPFPPARVGPRAVDFVSLYFLLPLLFIGPPTVLMGLSFPYLQKVVQQDLAYLGRRVGWLQTANIGGSMLGAILAGWVLLPFLGTSTTLRLLVAAGGVFLLLYLTSAGAPRRRRWRVAGLTAALLLGVMTAFPEAGLLWAKLHGAQSAAAIAREDGSGLAVLKTQTSPPGAQTVVYVNGIGQSEIPYGGIHATLGLVPALLHPHPEQIAIIGLGSGDTAVAVAGRPETQQVSVIEIIASEVTALQEFDRRQPDSGVGRLFGDGRIKFVFGDGRSYIRLSGKKYDIIEADALRPTSAYSGNLYSLEYFRMLQEHLTAGGFAVTWAPTVRIRNGFVRVFPYVLVFPLNDQDGLLIGSNQPLAWDGQAVLARSRAAFTQDYYRQAGIDLGPYGQLFASVQPRLVTPGESRAGADDVNTDIFPKDEYLVEMPPIR